MLHFRVKDGGRLEDGPLLVTFQTKPLKLDLTDNRDNSKLNVQMAVPEYLLFLKRRGDDRYEPVSGRVDPELSVRELYSQNLSWLDGMGER